MRLEVTLSKPDECFLVQLLRSGCSRRALWCAVPKPILSPSRRQRIIAMQCSDAPDGRARWDGSLVRGPGHQTEISSKSWQRNHSGPVRKPWFLFPREEQFVLHSFLYHETHGRASTAFRRITADHCDDGLLLAILHTSAAPGRSFSLRARSRPPCW